MSKDLAVVQEQPHQGLSLIEGPDPATAVAYARQVSAVISQVLEKDSGYVLIQRKKHITIEGWQTLSAMTGHTVEVEWSRPLPEMSKGTVTAWEARAIVRDQTGRVVGAGDSMADPNESAPWTKNNYSVRSMAQTRAMSRALASRMRYIVTLAGFAGTPAEEMEGGPAVDHLQVARDRFVVLRGLVGNDNDTVKAVIGDKPEVLAEDAGFATAAYTLGWNDGHDSSFSQQPEVIDAEPAEDPTGDEALADKLFAETGSREDVA